MNISAVQGDITVQDVDAIVNAANRAMRGGGGVDGAIHRAGGPGILDDCIARFPTGLATGDAGWTTGGLLPARWVIHVVGPNRHAGETDRALLLSCYTRALEVATSLEVRSIAFPLVGAGVYGWSAEESVACALEALRAAPADCSVTDARIVAFGGAAYDMVAAALG
jgi:O-acetyl-ADP-ribose deacetylase